MPKKSPKQFEAELAVADGKLPDARAQLLRIPGVVKVLVGLKETRGLATETVAFQVYIDRKKPVAELAADERIPETVLGIPTDVIVRVPIYPHDVLCGGMPVTQDLWGMGRGTLGVVGLATAANTHAAENTPLALTNHHVASTINGRIGIGCLCDSWCCKCCDVGNLVDASQTDRVDGSIATLNAGVRFSHDILGIGAIRGAGLATRGMAVVKYGTTSGLSHGTVTQDAEAFMRADKVNFVNQIRVTATAPDKAVSLPGDSGSVYLEEATRRVVGLNHAGTGVLGFACHIADVTAALNISFPVTGSAGAIPLSAIEIAGDPRTLVRLVTLRQDLESTETGKQWVSMIQAHSPEVRRLVNEHRAAKVAWQRCHGPAFLAHFLKSARDRTHRVPREIEGTRLENAIVSMAAVLRQYGSPDLTAAVAEHYLTVLECAGSAGSADDAISRVATLAGGAALKRGFHAR